MPRDVWPLPRDVWPLPRDVEISFGPNCGVPKSKAGARQYIFNLTVAAPPPPVVKVVGPSSVSDACSFRDLERKNGGGMLTCHLFLCLFHEVNGHEFYEDAKS